MDSPSCPRRSKMLLTSSRRITSQATGHRGRPCERVATGPCRCRNRNDYGPRRQLNPEPRLSQCPLL
jgi:hypothetical protein